MERQMEIFWNDIEIPEINHWPYLVILVKTNDHIMADFHIHICPDLQRAQQHCATIHSKAFLLQSRYLTTKISSV